MGKLIAQKLRLPSECCNTIAWFLREPTPTARLIKGLNIERHTYGFKPLIIIGKQQGRNRRDAVFCLYYDSTTGEKLPDDALWKHVSRYDDLDKFVKQAEEIEGRHISPEEVDMIRQGTWRSILDEDW